MKNQWRKLGLLYSLEKKIRHPKLRTHAANPLAIHLKNDVYRIFYSGRDENNRSSVGAVDIDIIKRSIIEDHFEPFFLHGEPGSYFADGVSIGCSYIVADQQYILFMGWQSLQNQHWRGDIGRLSVSSNLTLNLDSRTTFMSIDEIDPISLSYPWVIKDNLGQYQMWYGSTITWDAGNNEMLHVIHHATSHNGDNWNKTGIAIPYEIGRMQAFSRPTAVYKDENNLEMWFSYRNGSGNKYRIGHAQRINGKWSVLTPNDINVSSSGWDSEMIEYPFVFDHKGQRFMLYNGNGFGKSGFGLAVME